MLENCYKRNLFFFDIELNSCFFFQVLDMFQVVVACSKAIRSQSSGKLTTKNVYSEIIYNLSPNKKVSVDHHICKPNLIHFISDN